MTSSFKLTFHGGAIVSLLSICTAQFQVCNRVRPTPSWAGQRIISIPASLVQETQEESAWVDALCCVYTGVTIISSGASRGNLELYDDSSYRISGESMLDIMQKAMDDICDMSMGSQDCNNNAECVDRALAPPQLLPSCSSDRPNSWATHRTMEIPESMVTGASSQIAWTTALCCVYTHVTPIPGNRAFLESYDGSRYRINGNSMEEIASIAMDDICAMSMGAQDCNRRSTCVNNAMNEWTEESTPEPTPAPTRLTTPAPNTLDTTNPDVTSSVLVGLPPGACFPGDALVQVEDTGIKKMSDLHIGEKVLVEEGKYRAVYSFGHRDESTMTEYLQFNSKLELSRDHMVFVDGNFAPASSVKIGSIIMNAEGERTVVESISKTSKQGAYAPFTLTGKIIVNGIMASSFISFQDSADVDIFGVRVSWQWLAHSFETPHRLCFKLGFCTDRETYSADGISTWVYAPFQVTTWLVKQPTYISSTLMAAIVFILGSFALLENVSTKFVLLFVIVYLAVKFRNVKKTRV